jgi:hypothetical protein
MPRPKPKNAPGSLASLGPPGWVVGDQPSPKVEEEMSGEELEAVPASLEPQPEDSEASERRYWEFNRRPYWR